jgi:hypothetical protein
MYASQLGRFTGADPLLSSGRTLNPKTWNRYSYVLNNPLLFNDPTGLYECEGTKSQCKKFEKSLRNAETRLDDIAERYGQDSDEYNNTKRALGIYGAIGKKNGIIVVLGKTSTGKEGEASGLINGALEKEITVTIDIDKIKDMGMLETTIAHEGSHAADRSAFVDAWGPDFTDEFAAKSPLNLTSNDTETKAYTVSSVMGEFALKNELRPKPKPGESVYSNKSYNSQTLSLGGEQIWKPEWKKADAATVRANRKTPIELGLKNDKDYFEKRNKKFTD